MEVKYSIHIGTHFIQVFTEPKRCKGSILVQDVKKDMDSTFICPFNTIQEFKNAIIDLYEEIQVENNQVVKVSIGNESWLSIMPYTFNWHNAVRIGYTKCEDEDPMSLKNQNIIFSD